MQKHLIRPPRRRRVPTQFSWIDHRLVRDHHVDHVSAEALALYLFLVTVADAEGLSYYGETTLTKRLSLDADRLRRAREELITADLIAFESPLYQVLSLEGVRPR